MGYGDKQVADLEKTIAAVPCDLVLVATPIDLGRIIKIPQPSMRVLYDLEEEDSRLIDAVAKAIDKKGSN